MSVQKEIEIEEKEELEKKIYDLLKRRKRLEKKIRECKAEIKLISKQIVKLHKERISKKVKLLSSLDKEE